MLIDRNSGAVHLLDLIAQALTAPAGDNGLFQIHSLLTASEFSRVQDRAHYIAEQLYAAHMVYGSIAQAETYLGHQIAHATKDVALAHLFNRVFTGELIEVCHHKLLSHIEGIVIKHNQHDDDTTLNFYDHELEAFGYEYLLESKRLPWGANGNIAWSEWQKIRTAYNACAPTRSVGKRLDFIMCSKCHPNMGILAPVAVIRGAPFHTYTVDSKAAKQAEEERKRLHPNDPPKKIGPIYMHLKDKTRRGNDHRLINQEMFGFTGQGTKHGLCLDLLTGYKQDPNAYRNIINDTACLEDDMEASDFYATETLSA